MTDANVSSKTVLQFIGILIANSTMIVLVVGAGNVLPNYMYSFAVFLPLFAMAVFYVLAVFESRRLNVFRMGSPNHPNVCKFWISGIPGLFWACNYVFLLAANPYVSGPVQVLLNQLNLAIMLLFSRFFLNRSYSPLQYAVVGIVFVMSILPGVVQPSGSVKKPLWGIFYFIGSSTIGLAMCWTDNVSALYIDAGAAGQTAHRTGAAEPLLPDGVPQPDQREQAMVPVATASTPSPVGKNHLNIPQYYFFVNLWAMIFTSAFFFVPLLSYKEDFYTYVSDGLACIFGGSCSTACSKPPCLHTTTGVRSIWLSSFASYFSAYFAALLMRTSSSNTVMLSQMALEVAPAISTVLFTVIKNDIFHSTPSALECVCTAIVVLAAIVFKLTKMPALQRHYVGLLSPMVDVRQPGAARLPLVSADLRLSSKKSFLARH